MASFNYVDPPNTNLICCICRMPFTEPTTTRTCSHTFCKECIIRAISHTPLCPVDRSPLTLGDVLPASPIVRSLVEELIVECPHRSEGCTVTCQRQLLASHLTEGCHYSELLHPECDCCRGPARSVDVEHDSKCKHRLTECEGCKAQVKVLHLESHNLECPEKIVVCPFCSSTFLRSDLTSHNAACPEFVVACLHTEHGCPWTGPRHSLSSSHIQACPYESIKGFFSVNNARMCRLSDENIILKHKVELLESALLAMKRELQSVKSALGPWYRPDGAYSLFSEPAPVEGVISPELSVMSIPRRFSFGSDPITSPPITNSLDSLSSGDVDVLASYFPPQTSEDNQGESSSGSMHRTTSTTSQVQDRSLPQTYSRIPGSHTQQTSVAPINLSTTLEGSLVSLRESVVSLSGSVDSLARRSDIALRNETHRLNDDILTLRANMHGLRMQVHGIMMDRNAQVTGRPTETTEFRWPSDGRFHPYLPHMAASPPSITKL